jgi:putative oxidoreductase
VTRNGIAGRQVAVIELTPVRFEVSRRRPDTVTASQRVLCRQKGNVVLTFNEFSAGLLILRLVVGLTLASHGYQKFFLGGRIPGTARWFDSIGMRPGRVHALAAACTEIGAGLAFAAGFLTPFAAAGMVSVMLVAAWTVHRNNGWYSFNNGFEYNVLIATVGIAVATTSAGRFSIDHLLNDPQIFFGWGGFLIAVLIGFGGGALHLATFYRPPAPESPKS